MTVKRDRKPKPKTRLSVSLRPRDHAHLEEIALKKKVSLAWVVREAVEHYLARETPLLVSAKFDQED